MVTGFFFFESHIKPSFFPFWDSGSAHKNIVLNLWFIQVPP